MKSGAQLYTVREFTQTLEDFSETLKKVADMGYTTVQVSGTCAYDPEWLKGELDKNGLVCAITHSDLMRIAREPQQVAAEHAIFGCRYIGMGFLGDLYGNPAAVPAFIERYAEPAKVLKRAGAKLMYHNHGYEFMKANGVTLLQRLANAFPADELGFTLDSYWVQYAGGDPAQWAEILSGRVDCVHIKDMKFDGTKPQMAYIGEGNMNIDGFLTACQRAGTQYVLVEQDDCQDRDPFWCLKQSYDCLKAHGLE